MTAAPRAAVFALDGVVTRTARVHLTAWKQLFDDLLARRPRRPGEVLRPFDEEDYRAHLDGKPRHDGIRDFLGSRGIVLPEGGPDDPPGVETVASLGRRKNALYLTLLDRLGVDVDPAAVRLVHELHDAGFRVGLASSSRNAAELLERAGLEALFDARVDGVVVEELGLRGKPHPDAILECLRRLGVSDPGGSFLLEDAASGVRAGKAAGLGLVVGVDRGGEERRLAGAGADLVVQDLGALSAAALLARLEAHGPEVWT